MTFDVFNFNNVISKNLNELKLVSPTPIQAKAIPVVLDGKDVMGLAQTGTGKTAAFLLPIIQNLMGSKSDKIRALIIAPTRELAEQIKQVASSLCRGSDLRVSAVYGGVSMIPQMKNLRQCDILIACPGRLLDHIERRNANLKYVEYLVLDEADQMFDMGFLPDIRRILKVLPESRQSLLFSATMPDEIRKLAEDILKSPVTVQAGEKAPASTVEHALYPVPQHLKSKLLVSILKSLPCESVLVFTRTKHQASKLETILRKEEFEAAALHGNLSQAKRQTAMSGFRSGKYQILVATDIAARGVDISSITHVINYDIPATTETYTHRIGRTGRAQKTGDALTFITRADEYMVRQIEKVLKSRIERRTVEGFDYKAETETRPASNPSAEKKWKQDSAKSFSDRANRQRREGGGDRPFKKRSNRRDSHSNDRYSTHENAKPVTYEKRAIAHENEFDTTSENQDNSQRYFIERNSKRELHERPELNENSNARRSFRKGRFNKNSGGNAYRSKERDARPAYGQNNDKPTTQHRRDNNAPERSNNPRATGRINNKRRFRRGSGSSRFSDSRY